MWMAPCCGATACGWPLADRRGPLGQLLAALACLPWLIGWQLRLVSTGRFKQQTIAAFGVCEAVNRAEAAGRADWLLSELRAQLRPEALQRLRWHQQRGDRVLLCSASPRLLLQPLADWLGVELLCTELEQQQGQWQPKLSSPNCKGPEKVRRLEQHLGPLEGLTIEAYGDSKGDRELLQAAALPHYRSFLSEPQPYPGFLTGAAAAGGGPGAAGLWAAGDLEPGRSAAAAAAQPLAPDRPGPAAGAAGLRHPLRPLAAVARCGEPAPTCCSRCADLDGLLCVHRHPRQIGRSGALALLKQECGVPVPPTLMALVVERLTDGTAVLLLLVINLPLLLRWQVPLAVPIGIALFAVLVGWLVLRSPWAKAQLKGSVKRLLPRKLASAGGDGLAALRQLLQPGLLLQATVIGALAWSLEGVSLWLLLRGMGIEAVGIGGATIAHTAAGLLGALTLLPGGLGSTEAGTVGLLALQGVGVAAATPATLLIRLMTLWFATALGVGCLLWQPRRKP